MPTRPFVVDGQPIDQSYILEPPANPVIGEDGSAECGGKFFGPITVPDGNVFVMGDNRTNSADSRYHMGDEFQGTIPEDNIRGKVSFIILPLTRIGPVKDREIQQQQ